MEYISRAELKSHRAGNLKKEIILPSLDLGNRQIKFTVSTPDPDRSNDVVNQDGWILNHYLRNPVVLWGHDSKSLPVGKCISIGVEDGCLKAVVEFVDGSVYPLAETIYQMCLRGFLSATSVGFIPRDWDETDDDARGAGTYSAGVDFHQAELLEFSIVCTPDNPRALIEPGQQTTTTTNPVAADETSTLMDTGKSTRNSIAKLKRARLMELLGHVK